MLQLHNYKFESKNNGRFW